mmetsp:Transcript_4288/g.9342  ORF Transcript_4288/g.9342 Transcript_4288/m.9342 type:complete len:409 (-) Transcript_4288:279-1505(-)
MEGIGGPINVERYSAKGIDPTLDDCCRREVLGNRKHNALTSTLRRHDVAALAERRRRHLVTMPVGDSHHEACRCSCDPNSDGGEYRALMELKERKRREQEEEEKNFEETKEQIRKEEAEYERKTDLSGENSGGEEGDSDDEFDYLLDEDFGQESETIRKLEEERRAELEYHMLMRNIAGYHGYGIHRQVHPNRVLKIAGLGRNSAETKRNSMQAPPQAVVLHLVDPDLMASASLDYFIETELAKDYPGTIFMRSGGRSVLLMDSALAQKSFPSSILNPDKDLPALLAIRDGVVINACPRLRGIAMDGGDGEIEPHAVRQWLDRSRVLLTDIPVEDVCLIRPEEEAHMDFMISQQQKQEPAPPPPEEEHYKCGVEGCHKSFRHEHVGIQTSEQSGLVVQEETILGNHGE